MLKRMDGKWLALVLIATVMVASNFLFAQSAAQAPITRAAVVDMEQVLEGLAEREKIESDVRKQLDDLKSQFEGLQNEVKNLRADLEMLVPGGKEFESKQAELQLKAFQLKAFDDFQKAKMTQEFAAQRVNLYRKISESAGQVARQQGFNLVLTKEIPLDDPKMTLQQMQESIQSRKVLWAADETDISTAVIAQMNNEFNNRQNK